MAAQTHRDDAVSTAEKWDAIYRQTQAESQPAAVLAQHTALLPDSGKALDLACGLGANALLLAECGLQVDALDISAVAIECLHIAATHRQLAVSARVCDLTGTALPEAEYDVIVVSRFLARELCPALIAALKPGGLLFYQTYTLSKCETVGPNNPDYLLQAGELLTLFASLQPVFYQDYGRLGDLNRLERNEAQFIGKKQ